LHASGAPAEFGGGGGASSVCRDSAKILHPNKHVMSGLRGGVVRRPSEQHLWCGCRGSRRGGPPRTCLGGAEKPSSVGRDAVPSRSLRQLTKRTEIRERTAHRIDRECPDRACCGVDGVEVLSFRAHGDVEGCCARG